MSQISPAQQAAINKFLNGKLGWVVGLDNGRRHWIAVHVDGNGCSLQHTSEAKAWASLTNFFDGSDASYGALHRLEAMLTAEQWALYVGMLPHDVEFETSVYRAAMAKPEVQVWGDYGKQLVALSGFAAAKRIIPCATCAPILARVLGFEEVNDGR